ncbi:MAG: aminotransferase class I/II-fold pyridoxal phosphate-dependent enzyme [Cytophagales bacterium]
MNSKIWLSSPHMGGTEIKYIQDAFSENWIAPLGPNVNNFEKDIEKYTGSQSAAALSAGTAALHLALILLGIQQGDEVICSSFTFSASANPIVYQGATPIFIDSETETWNMCPILLEQAIKDRIAKGKKPKAVILVHLYGQPAKLKEIVQICNSYDIPLIEDAAESLGSTYEGKMTGTFGTIGIYSFNGNKIITTSGGGALVSDNIELVQKARFLATQARDNAPHYQHSEIGYNYRMSNVVAGIGRGQMEVLDERIEQRRANFRFYKEKFKPYGEITFQEELENTFANKWLTCILINSENYTRESVRLALEAENIESRPLWKPMHMQPIFEKYPFYGNGTSEELFNKGLCLPSGSNLTEEDLNRIWNCIDKVIIK